MPPVTPLPASRLHAIMDPARIPWEDSSCIPRPRNGAGSRSAFQPRFLQAMDLALAIQTPGYNIYVSGESNLGRTYTLLAYLEPQARKAALPPDLVYVNNFADPDSPILLSLPAGQGRKLKESLSAAVEAISRELPRRFEGNTFMRQRAKLMDKFQQARNSLLSKMNSVAAHKGFNLDMDEGGSLTLSDEARPIGGGFLLVYGGIEENCTIKAVFDSKREELSDRVNRLLFG